MKKEVCEKCIYGQRIDSAMACYCNYYHSPIAVTNRTTCSHYKAKELEPYIKIEALKNLSKPNKSCEDDLISRQDAIEAIATVTMSIHLSNVLCDKLLALPSADRPTGECRTCGRNADNGGVHEDGRTKCPIQEHYALLLDGYCHLYEPYDCGAKMCKGGEDE